MIPRSGLSLHIITPLTTETPSCVIRTLPASSKIGHPGAVMFRRLGGSIIATAVVLFAAAGIRIAVAQSEKPVVVLAYGDARFTDPANVTATNPIARKVLIARMAEERPDAIVISGDVPWHGGVPDDYVQFRRETEVWRSLKNSLVPPTRKPEFSPCEPHGCPQERWEAVPRMRRPPWPSADPP